ncbi:polysaccharide biosynthesis protein [Nocardioides marmoriginsengisoli]|uniref:Polysaccharide biosynthesis protein n=2 Tax=Nocardioides marmoriginsengisoli TaxID=661483 RepID=A0A3N0CNC8_9ACTN|nr:polysaccharide biosynthesis protein [Nocardioides marmoriginsengisoli]
MGVMNVATYVFTIFAAHVLGPREYGGVASLMGLLLVVNVLALGLQATGARRVVAAPENREQIEASVMAATYRSALGLGLLCLALTPLISWGLALDNWSAAAMIGVSAVPLTIMGGQAGILQGEERWVPLAAVYLGMGLGRMAFGLLLMPSLDTAFGAMLAVALGAWVPAAIGALVLRHRKVGLHAGIHARGATSILREVASNSYALLAFFALTNIDVIVARARFDEHEAGLYAGGLILTKAVLFLPQFVVVIAFPSMASSSSSKHRMYLRGLAAVGLIGAVATAGAVVLSSLAVSFVGGSAYQEVEPDIWAFATLGTLLALIQLMVYEVVARQHRASVLIVWAGLVAVGAAAMLVNEGHELVRAVALVDLAVLVTLVLVARFHPALRNGDPEPLAGSGAGNGPDSDTDSDTGSAER